ncbi:MAG: hypothetical protein KatS3mg057_2263 [Herpetosiphonaceae bacterium]|nr:MAG: hypothetical protein KatS3mg057_2263 [Herpetosiphonaceae bacterium]
MSQNDLICYVGNEPATATCITCRRPICEEHTQMGQPFISLGDLGRAALQTPAMLFGPPLDEVPYCPTCREDLANRRTAEQMKLLAILLLLLALAGLGIYAFVT